MGPRGTIPGSILQPVWPARIHSTTQPLAHESRPQPYPCILPQCLLACTPCAVCSTGLLSLQADAAASRGSLVSLIGGRSRSPTRTIISWTSLCTSTGWWGEAIRTTSSGRARRAAPRGSQPTATVAFRHANPRCQCHACAPTGVSVPDKKVQRLHPCQHGSQYRHAHADAHCRGLLAAPSPYPSH